MNLPTSRHGIKVVILCLFASTHVEAAQVGTKSTSEANLSAVQVQVLEATRKTAESAIEQNKQALALTQQTAIMAIEAAKASNEHIKGMFTWSASLLGILGGVMVVLGYRELRTIRKSFKTRLEGEVKNVLAQVLDDAREKQGLVTYMGVEVSTFSSFFEPIRTDKAKIKTHSEALLAQVKNIEDYALQLDDKRTVSWAQSHRAVVYYYLEQYQPALSAQKEACKFIVPHTRFDRERNLACIAAKVFENSNDPKAFELSVNTLGSLQQYVIPRQAMELVGDDDLKSVFEKTPQIKVDLQAIANSGTRI